MVGLKPPDIGLIGEEKPRKNLTMKICPNRGSIPGPLRERCECCSLLHNGGLDLIIQHKIVCFALTQRCTNVTFGVISPHYLLLPIYVRGMELREDIVTLT